MRKYAYRIVNVFTRDGTLTGNPLCVFENGEGLSDAEMQALALQFNLSETTFILPSDKADARVRIFTPAYEMPFAGHPTLGTAHVVDTLKGLTGQLNLEMKAGIIPVSCFEGRWRFRANKPTWREFDSSLKLLAEAIGVPESAIGERPLWVNAGKEQLVIPLTSSVALKEAKPDAAKLLQIQSEDGHSMAYLFASGGGGTSARFFFPKGSSLLEDPATGSACANLGGWHVAMGQEFIFDVIHQGDLCGRPSTLYLELHEGEITVGGEVIELGAGVVHL